jgi:uncharacterized damage-inducible protein DinB
MNRPTSDIDALRGDLRSVYDGSPWHGSSITTILADIDAETAARRNIPNVHTIWELVLHMTGWTREVTARVRGGTPKSPPEDWPQPRTAGGEKAWRAAREDLTAAHQELVRQVDSLEPADLVRWIGDERDPALGAGVTVGTLIRGLLQHHTYHQGQIALLKVAAAGPRIAD